MSLPAAQNATIAFDPLLEQLSGRTLSGPEYARARSLAMDETLTNLLGDDGGDLCLIALGGYGRAELCPYSDIDLMFLCDSDHKDKIESFLYALWDRGLKVGHSVRSMVECLSLAKRDSKILTSLLDMRVVAGNVAYGESLRAALETLLSPAEKKNFVQSKLAERDERHARYGDTRYVLEPNIKEGKGALRDFQTLMWITHVVYGARTLDDLVAKSVLTEGEARRFSKSHDFLLTVRCHLHELAGRAEERLHFDVQPDLAARLGYADRHTGRAVERFMKHYFLVTRDMGDLTRILCAAIEHDGAAPRTQCAGGFEVMDSRIVFSAEQDVRKDPVLMLRLFRAAQETGLDIHPFALKTITRNLKFIDDRARNDEVANALFLDILTDPKDSALMLRRMNESGVLGKFIPDFGRIIALMQFDRYHYFTVDEHIIRCVDLLHALRRGDLRGDAPVSTDVAQGISRMTPLLVAMFLHDICKGRGGRHADLGGELALTLCPRLGLSGEDTDLVSWLVHEHLLMSDTAFRRNLNDPKTIADFSARMLRSRARLDMLFCLTTADIMGVGPGRWTAWKARLLEELYLKTAALLDGAEPGMVGDITLPAGYMAGETRIDITNDDAQSATVIVVTTPDRDGLFATLCGALSAEGANIMRAYINTVNDKKLGRVAVDRFIVQNASGLPFYQARRQDDVRQSILAALSGALDIDAKIGSYRAPLSKKERVFDIPPKIRIDNDASGADSVVEIETRDRHGLLYDIACTFREEGLDIRAAKINTQGLRAIDSFYVQTAKRKKLTDSALQERLMAALKAKVAKP